MHKPHLKDGKAHLEEITFNVKRWSKRRYLNSWIQIGCCGFSLIECWGNNTGMHGNKSQRMRLDPSCQCIYCFMIAAHGMLHSRRDTSWNKNVHMHAQKIQADQQSTLHLWIMWQQPLIQTHCLGSSLSLFLEWRSKIQFPTWNGGKSYSSF